MANKRALKQEINFIAAELVNECLLRDCTQNLPAGKCDALIDRILDIQEDFLRRVGTPDGKNNPQLVKKYYRKLVQDFDAAIGEVLKEMEA